MKPDSFIFFHEKILPPTPLNCLQLYVTSYVYVVLNIEYHFYVTPLKYISSMLPDERMYYAFVTVEPT